MPSGPPSVTDPSGRARSARRCWSSSRRSRRAPARSPRRRVRARPADLDRADLLLEQRFADDEARADVEARHLEDRASSGRGGRRNRGCTTAPARRGSRPRRRRCVDRRRRVLLRRRGSIPMSYGFAVSCATYTVALRPMRACIGCRSPQPRLVLRPPPSSATRKKVPHSPSSASPSFSTPRHTTRQSRARIFAQSSASISTTSTSSLALLDARRNRRRCASQSREEFTRARGMRNRRRRAASAPDTCRPAAPCKPSHPRRCHARRRNPSMGSCAGGGGAGW